MRIEVNDEAARLRCRDMPVKCQNGKQEHSGDEAVGSGVGRCSAPECRDCGSEMVSCRCHPGEG